MPFSPWRVWNWDWLFSPDDNLFLSNCLSLGDSPIQCFNDHLNSDIHYVLIKCRPGCEPANASSILKWSQYNAVRFASSFLFSVYTLTGIQIPAVFTDQALRDQKLTSVVLKAAISDPDLSMGWLSKSHFQVYAQYIGSKLRCHVYTSLDPRKNRKRVWCLIKCQATQL